MLIDYFSFQLESRRFPLLQVRASSSEETSTVDADELFSDLKEKVRIKIQEGTNENRLVWSCFSSFL